MVSTAVSAMAGAVMILIWKARKTYAGFGFRTAGNGAAAAGVLLFALRGIIPGLFAIIPAAVPVLSSAAPYPEGTRLFRGAAS